MKHKWIIALLVFLGACQAPSTADFDELLSQSDRTVLMFFAPDCPLCITFSKPVNELKDSFREVQFLAVMSGEHYSQEEVQDYFKETGLNAQLVYDPDYLIARKYHVQVTPEFLLVNAEGVAMYQGLLDDRMESIGVYKKRWSNFFLYDALLSDRAGVDIYPERTTAIGCVLEY